VVVTRGVTDAGDQPLARTTLGQMELFTNPLCTPSPACAASPSTAVSAIPSLFSGVQAAGLEAMRLALQPVSAKISADHGVARDQIAMAYTYRTQSIASVALQLGAAPYQKTPSGADAFPPAPVLDTAHPENPLNPRAFTPAETAARYGVEPALVAAGIDKFLELYLYTYDLLSPQTGAFVSSFTTGTPTPIPALVALPAAPAPADGYPLVVFHHGLTRSRGDMLLIAQALAGSGMVVAAIDAAKHGARAWCTVDTTQTPPVALGCAAGVTCDTSVFGNQGDPATGKPGLCQGALQDVPVGCSTPGCWNGQAGNTATSGAFTVAANLFRTRDTIRQDILDQSMLVRVLTTAEGRAVLGAAAGSAAPLPVNPAKVWYVGQSWGSVLGTADLAANPRFSRAVLNVGGGTTVDIFTTGYNFQAEIEALLASIGIVPGTPQYLAFLQAAKWTLDPSDPLNFAANVVTHPLPDLLADPTGATPQASKAVLGEAARCDLTVPNATNQALYGNMGLAPLGPVTASSTPTLQWYMTSTTGDCPTNGTTGPGATHGVLLDFQNPSLTAKAQSNAVRHLLSLPVDATPVTP
jgi:dienelactone hydrolase